MKSVRINFKTGELDVADVAPPVLRAGGVLVQTGASLVSLGTEAAVIELARMNPVQKARKRPDLVRKVLQRAGQDGLLNTVNVVRNLVGSPLPLGYSSAGIVRGVGADVSDFQPGDRVACAGLGYANHAEVAFIPQKLAVHLPERVSFDQGAFCTVGAIALHGVRQGEIDVGETVAVIGLGLVGLLTAQICAAAGARVFGIDIDAAKVAFARDLGVEEGGALSEGRQEVIDRLRRYSRGRGADAVLITAGDTGSSAVRLAAEIARDRARVVALGDIGLNVPRRAYFEKELVLKQARSYGPGRYDTAYEEEGHDYPLGYVRWTENRNMEAFLDLVAAGKVVTDPLITHGFAFERAREAYDLLESRANGDGPVIGVLLRYDVEKPQPSRIESSPAQVRARTPKDGRIGIGVIGAGQFAQGILLPELSRHDAVEIRAVMTASGLTGKAVAEKYGARYCTADHAEIMADDSVDAVLIGTRHDEHAEFVACALRHGKPVFVEKPLAIAMPGLERVVEAMRGCEARGIAPPVVVGFNRRFSPLAARLKSHVGGQAMLVTCRVNAGPLPADHWTQRRDLGGGRIVGEVCHFIDLMQFLTGAEPMEVQALALPTPDIADPDTLSAQIRFSDGSVGVVIYASNGDTSFPKERIEVFGGGRVGVIDNWQRLQLAGSGRKRSHAQRLGAAKGHREEMAAFVDSIRTGAAPVPFADLVATTTTTFAISEALRSETSESVRRLDDLPARSSAC